MPPYRYTDEDCFAALREVAEGRSLTRMRYVLERKPHMPTQSLIEKRYRTWNEALSLAGVTITPGTPRSQFTKLELTEAVVRCAESLSHQPTPDEYREWAASHDEPSLQTILDRTGWAEILIAAGFPA